MKSRAVEGEAIVAELLLRIAFELGPEKAKQMVDTLQVGRWNLAVDAQRLELETLEEVARREALPSIVRDVERALGRPRRESTPAQLAELLAPLLVRAKAVETPTATRADPAGASRLPAVDAAQDPSSRLMELLAGKWIARGDRRCSGAWPGRCAGQRSARGRDPWPRGSSRTQDALLLLLRVLSGEGLVTQLADGRYQLEALGAELKRGALRDLARYSGAPFLWSPWSSLAESVKRGQAAFQIAHGADLFAYLDQHPPKAALYQAAVEAFTRPEALALAGAFDFSRAETLVDVGGGQGAALIALLQANSNLKGKLLDRPNVEAKVSERLRAAGLSERCQFIAGDFREAVPQGADLYLVMHVLHNWPDEEARAILERCASAMKSGGRILIVERILLPGNGRGAARFLDLEMLALRGAARERSKPEWRRLIGSAGLVLKRTQPLTEAARLLVCERRPNV